MWESLPDAGQPRALRLPSGRRLGYRVYPGQGAPVLLVHGAGSSMASWAPVVGLLVAARRCVVAVDLPGHGSSCASPGAYRPEDSVAAFRAMLSHEGVDALHVVGHSLGGALAVGLAQQLSDQVLSVTLVAPGGLGRSTALPLRAATLPGAEPVLAVAFARPVLSTLSATGRVLERHGVHSPLSQDALGSIAWLGDRQRRAAFLATLRQVVGPRGQRRSTLERLRGQDGRRYLVVWGSADPILPVGHVWRVREVLPDADVQVFARAGHEPHAFDPQRFADALLQHVVRQETS